MYSKPFMSIVHQVKKINLRHLTTDRKPILSNSLRESHQNVLRVPVRSSTPFVPPPNEYQILLKCKGFRSHIFEHHSERISLYVLSTIAALWLLLFSFQACANQVELVIHPSNYDSIHFSKHSKKLSAAAPKEEVKHKVIVMPAVKASDVSLPDDGNL